MGAERLEGTCKCDCGNEVTIAAYPLTRRRGRKSCSKTCPFAPNHVSQWRVNKDGYRERRINGKVVTEHRMVMAACLGEVVHHRNGNKLDNRLENLELTTAGDHSQVHFGELRKKLKQLEAENKTLKALLARLS